MMLKQLVYSCIFWALIASNEVKSAKGPKYSSRKQLPNARLTTNDTIGADSIIYVNAAMAENGDGTSWATAFNNLESAITAAQEDTEIWITQGTYTPSNTAGDTTATFRITQNNLYLYGGFQGTETSLDQRDPEKYVTIVSGQIDEQTNAFHVFIVASQNSYMDGLTISDGKASGASDGTSACSNCFGGGIYIKNTQQGFQEKRVALSVSNCIFTNNEALQGASIFGYIYVDLVVSNCQFTENKATAGTYHVSGGAGIYLSLQSTLTVTESTFTNNQAIDRGAAIYMDYGVDAVVRTSTFSNNKISAGHGGAIYVTDRSSNADTTSIAIRNCEFDSNDAAGYGGAVFLYYGCFAEIMSSTFTNNYAGLAGGAVGSYNAYSGNIASSNTFEDNTATEDPDVYTASFPHLGKVSNKISVFTSYLNRLSKNFDRDSEPDVRSTIIYVDNSVAESGDGKSWSGAVQTIDESLTIVQTIGVADCEIWVRGGTGTTYNPTSVPSWYDKTAHYYDAIKSRLIDLTTDVIIFGGFSGIETDRSQRDFAANPTQISAQIAGTTDQAHETYQVIHMGQNTRLDGFIVSDGQGSSTAAVTTNNIYLARKCEQALKNDTKDRLNFDIYKSFCANVTDNDYYNKYSDNLGTSSDQSSQLHSMNPTRGNGIMANNSGIVIANVLIVNNYGTLGAGLFVLYHTVSGNNIGLVNNVAESRGGALMVEVNAQFTCKNCFFEDNVTGRKGGAVYLDYKGSMTLSGEISSFARNIAYDGGGALGIDGSSSVTISCTNATFSDNTCFQDAPAIYEGSYGYSAGIPANQFTTSRLTTLTLTGNVPMSGIGRDDYFLWNYDCVTEN